MLSEEASCHVMGDLKRPYRETKKVKNGGLQPTTRLNWLGLWVTYLEIESSNLNQTSNDGSLRQYFHYDIVLTHPSFYNKNAINWITYKQQKFISYGSGGRVLVHISPRLRCWKIRFLLKTPFLVLRQPSCHRVLKWQRSKEALWGLFYKNTNLTY